MLRWCSGFGVCWNEGRMVMSGVRMSMCVGSCDMEGK